MDSDIYPLMFEVESSYFWYVARRKILLAQVQKLLATQKGPETGLLDFGCGTGKGSVKLKELGLEPQLIDFADNCRDAEAAELPFMEWDLTEKIPAESVYGFCTDVMEHIPTSDVGKVIDNIMACSEQVFFLISTVDDIGGQAIGATLHNTVKPHKWWLKQFKGYNVSFDQNADIASLFYVEQGVR